MWQYFYYVFAAVNVLTISLSLLLHKDTVDIFYESVKHQKKWADIENELGSVIPIFTKTKTLLNDDLKSKKIKHEIDTLDTTNRIFQIKIHQVEEEISKQLSQNNKIIKDQLTRKKINIISQNLQEKLKNLKQFMKALNDEAKDCFAKFQTGIGNVSKHIINADQISTKANFETLECMKLLNQLQSSHIEKYAEIAGTFEIFELLITLTVFFILIAAVIYGYFLSQRTKRNKIAEEEYKNELLQKLINCQHVKQTIEEKEKQIQQLLSYVSHDLLTPLNGILGFSHSLSQELTDVHQIHQIKSIKHITNDLLEHIKEISEFAKLESGKLALRNDSFSIKQILFETIKTVFIEAKKKKISVFVNLPPSIKDQIKGDKQKLKQVLVNLINNAVKFTPTGSIRINAAAKKLKSKYTRYTFSVQDTGIGIPEDKKNIIFEKFTQADKNIGNNFGGAGLGLAIAKEIVTLMNGNMEVKSKEGEGSTFTFTILAEEDSDAENLKIQKINRQIILLSDNPLHRQFLEPSLKEISSKVKISDNLNDLFQSDDNAIIFISPVFIVDSAIPEILSHRKANILVLDTSYDEVLEQSSKHQQFAGYLYHPLTGSMLYRTVQMFANKIDTDFIDNKSLMKEEEHKKNIS